MEEGEWSGRGGGRGSHPPVSIKCDASIMYDQSSVSTSNDTTDAVSGVRFNHEKSFNASFNCFNSKLMIQSQML